MDTPSSASEIESQHRRAVAWIVALTGNISPPASHRYAQQLLARHQRGELSFVQIAAMLSTSVYRIIYRSRAVHRLSPAQLQELLDQAHQGNARLLVTGLLLYSEGTFVQVLEGPEEAVRTLYAKIHQDSRHTQVEMVVEGLLPTRQFDEWSMDYGIVEDLNKLAVISAIELQQPLPGRAIVSTGLQALLQAFID